MEVAVNFNASGDNTILAASAGFVYRIIQLFLVPSGDTTLQFKSGANILAGGMQLVGNTVFQLPATEYAWFTCGVGEALVFNSSAPVQIGGRVVLDKIPQ